MLRGILRKIVVIAAAPLAHALAGRPPKKISAMMRVKNEAEFIEQSINSIIYLVDELVIVDNGSDDGTAVVIAGICERFPQKVKSFSYPHKIARYGEETLELAATRDGKKSPSFLPNYYNWCLEKCAGPYILKWDGDTIATRALAITLERFRQSTKQIVFHTGINLYPDRAHYIAGRPFEDMEPRLFYKRFSRYNNYLGYVETLWSPYIWHYPSFIEREGEPLYFHMKFCKVDRFANISDDLKITETALSTCGGPLPRDLKEQVNALSL